MARLIDRQKQVPGGFKFRQPEINWSSIPWSSFDTVVVQLMQVRRANPAKAKELGWNLDRASVENEVDSFNAKVCQDNGWTNFITEGDPPKSSLTSSVLMGVRQSAAGASTLADWIGEGGHPVDKPVSESRAAICVACPLNQPGDWTKWFTNTAATMIRAGMNLFQSNNLITSKDDQLHVCTACSCPLRLKVHVPIDYIRAKMSLEVRDRLDEKCWIRHEP